MVRSAARTSSLTIFTSKIHKISITSPSRHTLYTAELGSSAEERCPTSHDLVEPAPSSDKTARHRRRTSDQKLYKRKRIESIGATPTKKRKYSTLYAPYPVDSPSQASPVEFVNGAHDVLKRLNQAHGSKFVPIRILHRRAIPYPRARSSEFLSQSTFFFCRS
jgi:hypothetical protein